MKKLLIILTLAALSACQKKTDTVADPSKAVITITAPLPGHTYHSGDTVHIKATVTYPGELHGYETKITDTATGNIAYDNALHVHSDHLDIDETWPCMGTKPLALKMDLVVEIDHDGTSVSKTILFNYTP